VPRAYAASTDKPDSVMLRIGSSNWKEIDVAKEVATLDTNLGNGVDLSFNVRDAYTDLSPANRLRKLVFEDSSGKQTELCNLNGNLIGFKSDKLVEGQKLKLITSTKDASGNYVKRYERQLNVRVNNSKKAEQKPAGTGSGSMAGLSEDGGSWSFSNGLSYTFKNTGFKFLEGTTMNLGALRLPLQYKHNPDGTTIAGINCSPEDVDFYKAVKNGNVWQKYTTDAIAKKTAEMDKGWSGKKFGKWGGKSFDWNVCGYMEFNTKDPKAPRAVNLIISTGLSASGHAQYLIFTGTLTFTMGGKAMLTGKLTPGKGIEGKLGLGAYAGLELYIGVGLQYVASVGAYGKGRIDVDFQILPETYLDSIVLSGECGAKAKLFGFTVYTWKILDKKKELYKRKQDTAKLATHSDADEPELNEDGTATSPLSVDADTAYPLDSRDYLSESGTPLATQATESADTILGGIYGETELTCATTDDGPVIAYIADAAQVSGAGTRDAANRSVLVYSRLGHDGWSAPKVIDTTTESGQFADYSPTITTDGENCYVAWLAADSKIGDGATIGGVGEKLDVKVATITKDDQVSVETVSEESSEGGSMPANPKAVKVDDGLYVGWYTNETTGSEGEVIGISGVHKIRLYKRGDAGWDVARDVTMREGAMSSFDVGEYGGKAACAWSLDEEFRSTAEEVTLNAAPTLSSSSVYTLTSDGGEVQMVATRSGNAQFAKREKKDVLTYATLVDPNDGEASPYLSINSVSGPEANATVVLDGSEVFLPTSYYEIAGDLGENRSGNVSFLVAGNGTSDIQTLVTTGAGSADWTSVVEATADSSVVTDYCATYLDGQPLFIYTTGPASASDGEALSGQADDDGSVDLKQSTESSLSHLRVSDVDFDEFEVKTGENMPVTVHFENDGMLDVTGVDLWKLEDGVATKVASDNLEMEIDEEGSVSFDYTVPPKESFDKAREFTMYAAPAGATVTESKIKREAANGSAVTVSLGAPSLSLEVEHQIVDGQESVAATVTNDGVVPHGARLLFLNSDSGEELFAMDVPVLGEGETFTGVFDAPNGYFRRDGINNIIVTLEDDGTESEGYEINNTEFVSTWELDPIESSGEEAKQEPTSDEASAAPDAARKAPKAELPRTGDEMPPAVPLALLALVAVAASASVRATGDEKERR
ncbi:MAG: hypothetical protein J6D54_02140, partial [Olsenella sp.]|nr:hypothetical protein [Olsenella sp.]